MEGLESLARWALTIIESREPDFIIGDNYLRRWWIVPRNAYSNVYLHEFNRSDDDRALHDHPWASTSLIISGSYTEVTPEGRFERKPGDVVSRTAEAAHRVELAEGARVLSLFMTGPIVREWGFHCPNGWVHWRDFTAAGDAGGKSQTGRGCGA